MELLEVYRCPEFIYPVIYAAKFKHVKNAGAIRERIVKASTMEGPEGDKERDAVNFAFINAKLVSGAFRPSMAFSSVFCLDYQPSASADRRRPGTLCRVSQDDADKVAPLRGHLESQFDQ